MTLSLNYGSLSAASVKSKRIGEEIGSYINDLSNKVQSKICSVSGGSSPALSNANYYVKAKIDQLRKRSENAFNLSTKINDLVEKAKEVDNDVAKTICNNRKKLYETHSCLKPDALKRAWNSFVNFLKNIPLIGDFIKFLEDVADAFAELKNNIRDWWKYGGGKSFVDTILKIGAATLAIVVAIVEVVGLATATIVTGGAVLVAVAACICAVIATMNAITNCSEESKAREALREGKYGKAAVHSGRDSTAQWLREHNFNDSTLNRLSNTGALALDITDSIASTVLLVHDIGKLSNTFFKKNGISFAFKERVMGKDNKWTTRVTPESFRRGMKALITNQPLTRSTKAGLRTTLYRNITDPIKYQATLFKYALRDPIGYLKAPRSVNSPNLITKMVKKFVEGYKPDESLVTFANKIGYAQKLVEKGNSLVEGFDKTVDSFTGEGKTMYERFQDLVSKKVFNGYFSDLAEKTGIGKAVSSLDPTGNVEKFTGYSDDGILQKSVTAINSGRDLFKIHKSPYSCFTVSPDKADILN